MVRKRFIYIITSGWLALCLGLGACGDDTPTVPPATAAAREATAQFAFNVENLRVRLNTIVSTLVLKDVKQTRVLLTDFDTAWGKVEAGIKQRSPDLYNKMDEQLNQLKTLVIKTETPDLDKSKQAVQNLLDTITEFTRKA